MGSSLVFTSSPNYSTTFFQEHSQHKNLKLIVLISLLFFLYVRAHHHHHPASSRNVVSIFKLTNIGFGFHREDFIVNTNKSIVGIDFLMDGLYKLDLNLTYESNFSFMYGDIISIKSDIIKDNSSSLWYKILAYFSLKRIKMLVNDGILKDIDLLTMALVWIV